MPDIVILGDKQANLPVTISNILSVIWLITAKWEGTMASILLDEMRKTMRRRHYSIRAERSYCAWVKRYVLFLKMRGRADLRDGEKKIEAFLNHLAIELHVAPSTQNQAMNALVFLYKHVLKEPLDGEINAERPPKRLKLPVVLTHEETIR